MATNKSLRNCDVLNSIHHPASGVKVVIHSGWRPLSGCSDVIVGSGVVSGVFWHHRAVSRRHGGCCCWGVRPRHHAVSLRCPDVIVQCPDLMVGCLTSSLLWFPCLEHGTLGLACGLRVGPLGLASAWGLGLKVGHWG